MSEKNHGRPLPPARGRIRLKYEDVQNLQISVFQLFDQMERNYQRKAANSDEEGRKFQQALEQRIKLLLREKDTLDITDGKQQDLESPHPEEDTLVQCLNKIADLYKKRLTDKKENLHQLKNEFNEELRQRFVTHEYLQLMKEINRLKTSSPIASDTEEENLNSSIEEVDIIIDATPNFRNVIRTSTSTANKRIRQIEEKYGKQSRSCEKLGTEITFKRKQLEDINKQLNDLDQKLRAKIEELQTKEQEFEFKKQQLNELHQEFEHDKNQTIMLHAAIQTDESPEELQEEYSLVSGSSDEEDADIPLAQEETTHTAGHKLLENEFIRHGRKVWTDKEVKNYLRIYKNSRSTRTPSTQQIDTQKLNTEKLTIEISATIKTIYSGTQDFLEDIQKYNDKINNELEIIRSSKNKYSTLQMLQEQYIEEASATFKKIQKYCEEQIDKLQSTHYDLQEDRLDRIKTQIMRSMETHLEDHFKQIQDLMDKNDKQKQIPIQKLKPANQKLKKLIIVPNNTNLEVKQISKILREEAKITEQYPEIKNIRKTKNNNIEIKTTDQEFDTLSSILKGKSADFELIDPSERKMKLLLLRLPKEISKEELEEEIKKRDYLETFNILKSMDTSNQAQINWIIEAPAEECRKLVKQKKIKLFYEFFRTEFYIRITRCTKCQELNNHTKSQCKYRMRCGKCAGHHLTIDCKEQNEACINCERYKKQDIHHPAYSPTCPTFQQEKQKRLQAYYKAQIPMQNKTPNTSTNTIKNSTRPKLGNNPYYKEKDQISEQTYKEEGNIRRRQYKENRTRRFINETESLHDNHYRDNYEDYYKESERREIKNNRNERRENNSKIRQKEIKDRNGEVRQIRMRIIENSNRHNYQYPKFTREAPPPNCR